MAGDRTPLLVRRSTSSSVGRELGRRHRAGFAGEPADLVDDAPGPAGGERALAAGDAGGQLGGGGHRVVPLVAADRPGHERGVGPVVVAVGDGHQPHRRALGRSARPSRRCRRPPRPAPGAEVDVDEGEVGHDLEDAATTASPASPAWPSTVEAAVGPEPAHELVTPPGVGVGHHDRHRLGWPRHAAVVGARPSHDSGAVCGSGAAEHPVDGDLDGDPVGALARAGGSARRSRRTASATRSGSSVTTAVPFEREPPTAVDLAHRRGRRCARSPGERGCGPCGSGRT